MGAFPGIFLLPWGVSRKNCCDRLYRIVLERSDALNFVVGTVDEAAGDALNAGVLVVVGGHVEESSNVVELVVGKFHRIFQVAGDVFGGEPFGRGEVSHPAADGTEAIANEAELACRIAARNHAADAGKDRIVFQIGRPEVAEGFLGLEHEVGAEGQDGIDSDQGGEAHDGFAAVVGDRGYEVADAVAGETVDPAKSDDLDDQFNQEVDGLGLVGLGGNAGKETEQGNALADAVGEGGGTEGAVGGVYGLVEPNGILVALAFVVVESDGAIADLLDEVLVVFTSDEFDGIDETSHVLPFSGHDKVEAVQEHGRHITIGQVVYESLDGFAHGDLRLN